MAPFYSSFKPHDHWKKRAPPLTRPAVPIISPRPRIVRNDKFVASICDEKCLAWSGAEEDKYLVPVIDDDFNWFRLSIAVFEHQGQRLSGCKRYSWTSDERHGKAISTITDHALRFSRSGDLRLSRVEELMSVEDFLAMTRMSRCWEVEDDDESNEEGEDDRLVSPPLSRVWQSDRAGRVQTYNPNQRRMRWDTTICEEVEMEADVLVEMNANCSVTELEGSQSLVPPRCETHRLSVASVQTVKLINASPENVEIGIGRWSGVTLLNW